MQIKRKDKRDLLGNERRRQVAVAGIREQRYDGLACVFRALGQLCRCPQSRTGGNADEQAFTVGELARCIEGILVLYTDDLVVNLGVEHIRNEACADALNLVRAALAGGQDRRGIRLNGNNLDVRVLVLEVLAGAGDGAAGADACNKISTLPSVCFQISGPVVA